MTAYYQLSLFEPITPPPPPAIDTTLPADLQDWFFNHVAEGYYCTYTQRKIRGGWLSTEYCSTKASAIQQAHLYAVVYELYPLEIWRLHDPGPSWPHHYRLLEIAHEQRIGIASHRDMLYLAYYRAKHNLIELTYAPNP